MSRDPSDARPKPTGQWPAVAQQWRQLGPPLRPSPEDLGYWQRVLGEWTQQHSAPRVLLLGVTPELQALPWPRATHLLAVDHTQAMIDEVWPGPKQDCLCTDWLSLDLPKRSRDIALCDGGLHLLDYPSEQQRLVGVIRDVLVSDGLFLLRLFVPPLHKESTAVVLQDLRRGRIPNLNVLKLRWGMSLLGNPGEGVEIAQIWSTLHAQVPDLEEVVTKQGWSSEHLRPIHAYRDSTARYCYVTVSQVEDLFCGTAGGFEVQDLFVPSYELGDRCPTIVLRRRAD